MSDYVDLKEYEEFLKREKVAREKEAYAEAYSCTQLPLPLAYVFYRLKLPVDVMKDSLLEKALRSSVGEATDIIIDHTKQYLDYLIAFEQNGYNDAIERMNASCGKIPKDDERMNYDHAIRVLTNLTSCIAELLATKGFSQKEIIDTLIKTKFFSENFDEYTLFVLYKEGWEKLLRRIIETMPDGLRKKYAKTMHFPYWIVEALVKKGTISEETLRKELDKVIDFGWSCVEEFVQLGYPAHHADYIFPSDTVLRKIEAEMVK